MVNIRMDSIWWSLLIGLLCGGVLATVFGIYNKQLAGSTIKTLFGVQSTTWITDAIVLILAASFVLLSAVSVITRDLTYPINKPLNFTLETLLMAFLPSVVLFAMTVLRGYKINSSSYEEFTVLLVKFGLLHILLQFSGFYSSVFPPK
jgi:hypothetical protein